jgi:hypothetical protein
LVAGLVACFVACFVSSFASCTVSCFVGGTDGIGTFFFQPKKARNWSNMEDLPLIPEF